MTKPIDPDLQRIRNALRKGAIDRNAKTALALGVAMSGAIISAPALAVTATTAMASLYLLKWRKQMQNDYSEKLNEISEDEF